MIQTQADSSKYTSSQLALKCILSDHLWLDPTSPAPHANKKNRSFSVCKKQITALTSALHAHTSVHDQTQLLWLLQRPLQSLSMLVCSCEVRLLRLGPWLITSSSYLFQPIKTVNPSFLFTAFPLSTWAFFTPYITLLQSDACLPARLSHSFTHSPLSTIIPSSIFSPAAVIYLCQPTLIIFFITTYLSPV